MCCFFISKKKRLEHRAKVLTDKLNNMDRINKGFRSEISDTSKSIDGIKDESEKKRKGFFLFGRRREQAHLEGERSKLTKELIRIRNELANQK